MNSLRLLLQQPGIKNIPTTLAHIHCSPFLRETSRLPGMGHAMEGLSANGDSILEQ